MTNRNINIMPIAGSGLRFKRAGYQIFKPLIKVKNTYMFVKASKSFEKKDKWIFILKKNKFLIELKKIIKKKFNKATIITINKKTDGQARTVFCANKKLDENKNIFVTSCDTYIKFNKKELIEKLINNDFLVFIQKPTLFNVNNFNNFGWVKINKEKILRSSCKSKISSNPKKDWVIVGAFVFKNKKIFTRILKKLFYSKMKVNNEFYLDSCIEIAQKLKMNVSFIKLKKSISWGTPYELKKNFFK